MECGECRSKHVILDPFLGEYYCGDCAFVIEDNIIDFTDLSFAYGKEGRPKSYSEVDFTKANKGLGTPIFSAVSKLALKFGYIHRDRPDGPVERSFSEALPSLRAAWTAFSVPDMLKAESAKLYRKCIRKKLTLGRDTDSMALAVVYVTCENTGVTRDLPNAVKQNRIEHEKMLAYAKIIKEATSAQALSVKDYIRIGGSALALSDDLLSKAEEFGDKIIERRLEVGKHPAVVAGGIIYNASIAEGNKIRQADIAEALKVSERSIRRTEKSFRSMLKRH